ncbi:hypothetical protein [Allomuricauda sp. SCSIO 65647]|uniref:hypothetical protein n=1 Tax=Allomuricauda sp. SCSIO 65647 TaxID=2908843 RepID=UPI001F40696F|nr:hypothetical protein [Muricauda sp. SCSIO 65647]UJH67547.1 hypothetical protein L0P89_16560 [Muricauda sp. SCSIO 65647]
MNKPSTILTLCLLILILASCKKERMLPDNIIDQPLAITILHSNSSEQTKAIDTYLNNGADEGLTIDKKTRVEENGDVSYTYTLHALKAQNIRLHKVWSINSSFEKAQFLLPGFWYKRNLRSPENAPSFKTADLWSFREDRMSFPIAVLFDEDSKNWVRLARADSLLFDETPDSISGNLTIKTQIGSLGIGKWEADKVQLNAGFPFEEIPKSYQSKLKLNPPSKAFYPMEKGETIQLIWKISYGTANDFTTVVAKSWQDAFDSYDPAPVANKKQDVEIKEILSNYFYESYAETKNLKGFSGLWFNTKTCETTGVLSVGFCGQLLANTYNLLEYGHDLQDHDHIALARKVQGSYYQNGFTETGLIRELIYGDNAEDVYTLRKQSEGIKNLLLLLDFDKRQKKSSPEIEKKVFSLLHKIAEMQHEDGSIPRKFDIDYEIVDSSKGSTQSIITPMIMASYYFDEPQFLQVAIKAGEYAEKNIIDKADYFSSTLDSDCEDKEAAAIASISFSHLAQATDGAQREKYLSLAKKAAYFGLSWYYLYDVPFKSNSLLAQNDFKTRGWGNVSTENNHIDVWAFDFPHVLQWLGKETGEERFIKMSEVIISSIKDQMLPYEGHMVGVGKEGYMPEIVQHTTWDYGANGKGYLNSHMSVGWTIASVWETLTPGRFETFIEGYTE